MEGWESPVREGRWLSEVLRSWETKVLTSNPTDEVALRLADRYLDESAPRDAAGVVAWVGEHRSALYFSDTAGSGKSNSIANTIAGVLGSRLQSARDSTYETLIV